MDLNLASKGHIVSDVWCFRGYAIALSCWTDSFILVLSSVLKFWQEGTVNTAVLLDVIQCGHCSAS
jgi:hypothetical protein